MTARLVKRLALNFAIGAGLILLSLFVGMLAYHYFEDLRWLELVRTRRDDPWRHGTLFGAEE